MALPLLVPIAKIAASIIGWTAIDFGIDWFMNNSSDTGEAVQDFVYEPDVFMILTMAMVTVFVLYLLFGRRS